MRRAGRRGRGGSRSPAARPPPSPHSLVDAGWTLPIENETQNVANTRLFCVDPREGVAVVEVAKPVKLGKTSPSDPRRSLCVVKVQVDPMAQPLLERIECNLQIDHDYVARVSLRSTGRGAETSEEFHDLEFGLSLAAAASPDRQDGRRGSRRWAHAATPTRPNASAPWPNAALTWPARGWRWPGRLRCWMQLMAACARRVSFGSSGYSWGACCVFDCLLVFFVWRKNIERKSTREKRRQLFWTW